jgi:ABC-type Fe3+-siderophore transport system permease subunit
VIQVDLPDPKEDKTAEQQHKQTEDHTLVLTEPVPAEPVVLPHQRREEGQSILQTIIMVIGGIILVILLVLFARWLYHKVHHNDQISTSGTVQAPENPSGSSQPGANTLPSPQNSPSSGSSSNSGSSSQNGKVITNTGPGNVAAIFAGTTLAAAGLHYIISLRRFNKNGY